MPVTNANTQFRLNDRLCSRRGTVLPVTLIAMFVATLAMMVTLNIVNSDFGLSATHQYAQEAYYAAEAGVNNYTFHLNQDVNYWSYCTAPPSSEADAALNLYGSTTNRASVAGSSTETYAIQLESASTAPANDDKCDSSNAAGTMLETGSSATGTFRVLVTGYAGNQERSILVTYARQSFLNYIYYTKYETADPATYAHPSEKPVPAECGKPYAQRPSGCGSIDFIGGDSINGPLHTEDAGAICGSTPTGQTPSASHDPVFGRNPLDKIEFLGGTYADTTTGCTNNPVYHGTLVPKAQVSSIQPPPSDTTLLSEVKPAPYHLVGKTVIVLDTTAQCEAAHTSSPCLTETNSCTTGDTCLNSGQPDTVSFPSNGLIYVSNGTCSVTYTPYGPTYTSDGGCGNAYVSGNYSSSLTIAAENDVVINGNITTAVNSSSVPTGSALLGLIANNFVRVYHPLSGSRGSTDGSCSSATNATGTLMNPTIYASIFAVNHSFIVDNFDCGAALGTLSVYGSITQIYRGFVGTHSGNTLETGYAKNYSYDERLQANLPPLFINPVAATWHIYRSVLAFPSG